MKRSMYLLALGVCFACQPAGAAESPDPVEALKRFGDFRQVDLRKLWEGEILTERGGLLDFPNGISAQFCFAVPLPAEETARRLQTWDASPHESLKVYQFHPLSVPCETQDFRQLSFQSGQRSIRWLLEKTLATTVGKTDLHLTRAEAQQLTSCVQKRSDPKTAANCWAKLLAERAAVFQQRGLAGAMPYDVKGQSVSPVAQLRAMLHEQAGMSLEFAPLLKRVGLFGNSEDMTLAPFHYWTYFEADHHATLNLGAVFLLPVGDRYQLADVEYFVSNDYFTSASLYSVWPIRVGDQPGALVWRGDLLAAPVLGFTKGTDRIAFGALMVQDIKREIRCFLDDAKAKR